MRSAKLSEPSLSSSRSACGQSTATSPALRAQGATIDGEAGIGFILKPGFLLPPLMLSEDEVEAVVLGARWITMRGDDQLALSGRSALAKILAVIVARKSAATE
jgi:predicted DNA-binding transcriptional regulator YafY